ncbi:Baculoviral IAP repeat-containing protein 1a [Frankliniella fusca]|uniref:Baculoviral IAP repeat-containing protein 1a n=1 Tax=Frankliniella fusca TaxID=407009 RepID=A0AAE1LK64_9NEOP|nr:Baculoviral IAP repeat-containing protein 1a [Frankliniella fusca]
MSDSPPPHKRRFKEPEVDISNDSHSPSLLSIEGTEQSFQNEESNALQLSQDETQEVPWQHFLKDQDESQDQSLSESMVSQARDSFHLPFNEDAITDVNADDEDTQDSALFREWQRRNKSTHQQDLHWLGLMKEQEAAEEMDRSISKSTGNQSRDTSRLLFDEECNTADETQIIPLHLSGLLNDQEESMDQNLCKSTGDQSRDTSPLRKQESHTDNNDTFISEVQTSKNICTSVKDTHWLHLLKEQDEETQVEGIAGQVEERLALHWESLLKEDCSRSLASEINASDDTIDVANTTEDVLHNQVDCNHSQDEIEVTKSFDVDYGMRSPEKIDSMGSCSSPLHTPQKDLLVELLITPIKAASTAANENFLNHESSGDESGDNGSCSSSSTIHETGDVDIFPDESFVILENEIDLEVTHESENDIDLDTNTNADNVRLLQKALSLNNVKVHDYCELSVNEGILNVMDLYIQNNMSKADVQREVKSLCQFLPENHSMPISAHNIFKYILSLSPPMNSKLHYYCSECLFYYGIEDEKLCEVCGVESESGHFFEFDLSVITKYLFECRDLASVIDKQHQRNSQEDPTGYKDVKDGSAYKSLNVDRNKYDLNFIVNTDGVRIRKSSSKELWLIMICPVEVPVHLRKSFTVVVGVWYDTAKPNMNTFMRPLAKSMQLFSDRGIDWTHPQTGQTHMSKVILLMTVADAPARAMVQNLMRFNGKYGCNMCEIKTTRTAPVPNKKRIRVYQYKHDLVLRTKDNMLRQAEQALAQGRNVRGVKGPSVLNLVPSADCATSVIPEFMHSVLLGVEKQLVTLWAITPGEWSVSRHIPVIDKILSEIKHPDFVHRPSRSLNSFKFWKASDFYYFLLFESLIVLKGHLPEMYYQHYILFVKGIFLLLQGIISETDLEEANLLLRLFVNRFGNVYGERALTHNVHQLCHLSLCVRRYGPLFANSAFPFEDINGLIAKRTHGCNQMDAEIVNNIRICQGIQMLRNIVNQQSDENPTGTSGIVELLGSAIDFDLSPEIRAFIGEGEYYRVYSRAKIGYNTYSSKQYKVLKSSNFFITWKEQECAHYGSIQYFVKSTNETFVCVQEFRVDQLRTIYNHETLRCITHLVPVLETDNTILKNIDDISASVVKVGKIADYVFKRPNLYHHVM